MSVIPEVDKMCALGQIKTEYQESAFSELISNTNLTERSGEPSAKDIETGYELFHVIVYCLPIVFKMQTFINELISKATSRTVIQTIVHLFQSRTFMKEKASLKLAKQFYQVVATTLGLQYGNILLAISTLAQLQMAKQNESPFFSNYTDHLGKCHQESCCDFFQDIYRYLGTLYKVYVCG